MSLSFLKKKFIKLKILNLKKKNKNFFFLNFLGKRYYGEFSFLTFFNKIIYGLNLKRYLRFFCYGFGNDFSSKINYISLKLFYKLQKIFFNSKINYNLQKIIRFNKLKKKKLKLYMSIRQSLNLPSRGQRSKTNAKMSKSKRKGIFNLKQNKNNFKIKKNVNVKRKK